MASDESFRCFDIVRSSRPAMMISIELQSGEATGFAYSHLYKSRLLRNRLDLDFTSDRVELSGRNLRKLYRPLREGRVTVIREAREPYHNDDDEALIETILILGRGQEDC